MADYFGEIQAFDAALGLILKRLEELGELDRTVVIISGDHGPPGFPHGKCNLYDFGVGVPCHSLARSTWRKKARGLCQSDGSCSHGAGVGRGRCALCYDRQEPGAPIAVCHPAGSILPEIGWSPEGSAMSLPRDQAM